MGCTISPSLFVLAMQILLKATGSNIPEAHIGKGVYMPPIKAFMDDTTLIMTRKKVVQNTLDKLNLLGWCRMAFKPAKSRSLALVRGKIRRDVFFDVAEQRIHTVSEEPVKSLGMVFGVRQLPSRDNLQEWGLVEDTKCGLCGGTETLHHVLSNCTYALANGRYMAT